MAVQYLLGGAAAIYGIVVGGLYLMQDSLLFPRSATSAPRYPLPEGNERVVLRTSSGERIHGNLVRARQRSRGLLLGFTGNAWNADDCTVFIAHRFPDMDVVVFHYRGYQPSEGRPSEQALYEDALLIYDTFAKGFGSERGGGEGGGTAKGKEAGDAAGMPPPPRVYTIGFSLGSGVAAYLARHRPVAGQILVTPFDSVEAVAAARYFYVPVKYLIKHRFESVRHLEGLDIPTAVIAASDDDVVPMRHTEKLIARLERPVFVETVPESTHGGIYDLDAIDQSLRRAFEAVETAAVERPPTEPLVAS